MDKLEEVVNVVEQDSGYFLVLCPFRHTVIDVSTAYSMFAPFGHSHSGRMWSVLL